MGLTLFSVVSVVFNSIWNPYPAGNFERSSAAGALAAAHSQKPPTIQPEPFDQEGMRVICYPGDERHSLRERALPGPTRLHFRNRRFEPAGGLGELLG